MSSPCKYKNVKILYIRITKLEDSIVTDYFSSTAKAVVCSFNTEKEKRAEKYLNNIRQMPDLSGKSALEIMVSFSDW